MSRREQKLTLATSIPAQLLSKRSSCCLLRNITASLLLGFNNRAFAVDYDKIASEHFTMNARSSYMDGTRAVYRWLTEQGLTSPPTQYRLYGLQVKRPNQQYQSTEGKNTQTQKYKCTNIHKALQIPYIYINMGWLGLGNGSHRGQGLQAWMAARLPPRYNRSVYSIRSSAHWWYCYEQWTNTTVQNHHFIQRITVFI